MLDIKPKQPKPKPSENQTPAGESVTQAWDRKEDIKRKVQTTVEVSGHTFSPTFYPQNQNTSIGKGEVTKHPSASTSSSRHRSAVASSVKSNENFGRNSKEKKQPLSAGRKISGAVVLFLIMLILFIFTDLTSIDIFFWLFFLAMFWYRLDSRISIGGALAGLVIIMFLSAGQGFGWWQADNLMEQIAVGVYFFLVIGVVKQIWEYREEKVENNL
jgi:hypothetical protein